MDGKKELWLRLKHYDFAHLVPIHLRDRIDAAFGGPDASTRAFADKLARKLRWSRAFALRAIDEYRKFIYLGSIAEFSVTPSKVIDQVWHEHLLFSRGYREFCDAVLGRMFDHDPELVPVDEQTAAFRAQYDATLELYRTEFDRDPPEAIWGTPKFKDRIGPAALPARRRRRDTASTTYDDTPLYAYFADGGGAGDSGHGGSHASPEFGRGDSGGGGGGAHWDDGGGHGGHDGGHGG